MAIALQYGIGYCITIWYWLLNYNMVLAIAWQYGHSAKDKPPPPRGVSHVQYSRPQGSPVTDGSATCIGCICYLYLVEVSPVSAGCVTCIWWKFLLTVSPVFGGSFSWGCHRRVPVWWRRVRHPVAPRHHQSRCCCNWMTPRGLLNGNNTTNGSYYIFFTIFYHLPLFFTNSPHNGQAPLKMAKIRTGTWARGPPQHLWKARIELDIEIEEHKRGQ